MPFAMVNVIYGVVKGVGSKKKDKMKHITAKVKYLNKFKKNEDNKTFAVLSLLKYLPQETLIELFKNAIYRESKSKLNFDFGNFEDINFWLNWDVKNNPNISKQRVIPDALIRFNYLDIIVEAKKNDKGQQSVQQWLNEIAAYQFAVKKKKAKVILWALGGIHKRMDDNKNEILILKSSWSDLANAAQKILLKTERHNVRFILEDIITTLNYFSHYSIKWLEELEIDNYGINENSKTYLLNNPEKYDSNKWFKSLNNPKVNKYSISKKHIKINEWKPINN